MQHLHNEVAIPIPQNINGLIFNPGVYEVTQPAQMGGHIKLQGGPQDEFIFNFKQNLVIKPNTEIELVGGVKPENVYFNVKTQLSIGTNAKIRGNFLAGGNINAVNLLDAKESRLHGGGNVNLGGIPQTGLTAISNVFPMPQPIIIASGPTTFCEGGSVTLTANSGAKAYQWNTGETTKSITVTQSGTYTVVITFQNNCTDNFSMAVTVNPLPVADAGADQTVLFGQSVSLGTSPISGNTYSWTPTMGLDNPNVANPVASPVSTVTYSVIVTAQNGCSSSDDVQIIVFDLPNLVANQCGATNVSLTEVIASEDVPGATQYEFLIENDSAGLSEILISTDRFFQLTEFNGPIEYEKTYSIKVRVLFNGSYSQYGDVCLITTNAKGAFCSFDELLQTWAQNNPDLLQQINNQNNDVKNYIGNNPQTNHKTIPVVVHVMGTGSLNISYEQIKWQIAALNAAFAANYQNYNQQSVGPYAVNTQIQFCLAQNTTGVDNTGNPLPWTNGEPGVMRYGSTAPSVLDPLSNQLSYPNLTNLTHPAGQGRFPFSMYLNIWVVRHIDGTAIPGVLGFATFPPPNQNPTFDGIVMRADAFGDNSVCGNNFSLPFPEQGKVLAHEAGHYLGLYHTFEGGCAGMTNTNCYSAGDWCCDTPPTTYSTGNCTNSQSTCSESYFTAPADRQDMLENYMSYSNDECMNTFTFNQKQRMHGFLDLPSNIRNNLWQTANLALTGGGGQSGCSQCVIAANICYEPTAPCPGVSVNFFSPNGPGLCATGWSWNFGDGGMSAVQNPTHLYANAGTYTVTLTTTGAGQTATDSVDVIVASPTATLLTLGATTICAGSAETSVLVTFSGTPPFNATLTNGTVIYPLNTNNSTIIIPVIVTNENLTFTLSGMSDLYCSGTASGTVTYEVVSCCTNLVCNGDFEDNQSCPPTTGNNCFTSEYSCTANPPPPPGSGSIAITSGGTMNGGNWYALNHTPGGEYFMICDVSGTTGKIIWEQTIQNLTPGIYVFSAYFNNLIIPDLTTYNDTEKIPDLILLIDGDTVAGPLNIFLEPDIWLPLNFSFTLTTPGSVSLAIRTEVGAISNGKDLAIDDISFRQISDISASITAFANTPCASNTGTATVGITGGIAPYTLLWSDGQTTATANNLGAGNVFVTVTDTNGCAAIAGVTIDMLQTPPVVNITTQSTCNGANTGSAVANVTGGTPPYIYAWSNGYATQNIANLFAGLYSVTVTDANGCTAVASATVEVLLSPALAIAVNGACIGSNIISITVTAFAGIAPYDFAWSDGTIESQVISSGISNLLAGIYSVTVTGNNGCTATENIIINDPSEIIISFSTTDVACGGDSSGEVTANPSGGTSPYTYQWDANANNQITQTATGLTAGNYSVTVTDKYGCTATDNVTINEPTQLIVTITGNDTLCNGSSDGAATANPSGGASPYIYQWNDPASQTVQTATGLTAGNYSVTVTDANGCTQTSGIAVYASTLPLPTIAKTANNLTPGIGDNITYTITVCNPGITSSIVGMVVKDSLPPELLFVSSGDFNNVGGTLTSNQLFNLTPGQCSALQFVATVTSGTPLCAAITNCAEIYSAGGVCALPPLACAEVIYAGSNSTSAWPKHFSGPKRSWGTGVATDNNGTYYLTGFFSDPTDFGAGIIVPDTSEPTLYLVKYSDCGIDWVITGGEIQPVHVYANGGSAKVAVDTNNNLYVAGTSHSSINAPLGLNNIGGYIAKIDPANGNAIWAQSIDPNFEVANMAIDPTSGDVYVVGINSSEMYIVKYDNSGNQIWNDVYAGNGLDIFTGVAVDANSDVFVVGLYNDNITSLQFGSPSFSGLIDIFIGKYNSAGVPQWGKFIGTSGDDFASDVAVDNSGNFYVTGMYNNAIFTAGYDNATGAQNWFTTGAKGAGISIDAKGNNVATAGVQHASGGALFSSSDVFVDFYNGAGSALNTAQSTSPQGQWSISSDIALNSNGDAYITGGFCCQVTFGSTTLIGDATDMFAARVNNAGAFFRHGQNSLDETESINAKMIELINENNNSVQTYPNPSKGEFIVTLPNSENNAVIIIKNILGEIIYQKMNKSAGQNIPINLSGQTNGIYFVHIKTNEINHVQKIVLMR